MKTDILFINPGNHRKTYQDLSREFTAIAPPVWASLLANAMRRLGFRVVLYDVNVEGWDASVAEKVIQDYEPRLIMMMVYGHQPSASTQTMPSASKIARDLKSVNKDVLIAMGGTHPSALPAKTLREEEIDFVMKGEGLYTLKGLMDWLSSNGDLKSIKGLWYRDADRVVQNEASPVVTNLDGEFEGYAWDLLPDLKNYRAHNWHCFQDFERSRSANFLDVRTPYMAMNTSLGCPYSCHYCCINATFEKPGIRYWSLDRVMAWIDVLVQNYGIRNIRLDDELFILSPKRVERFCDMIIERGYDLNLYAYGRVDTIQEKLLKKLKKAGFNWICLGIESASEIVRSGVNKRLSKDIGGVVKAIQSHDIYVLGNYMFGLPDDTLRSMEETLQLAMALNCEFANFYTVMAYPGSHLYDQALLEREQLPDAWGGFSQHGYETKPLPTKSCSGKEFLSFRDDAYQRYFRNDRYLNYIRQRFSDEVVAHVQKMTQVKLKRKLLEEALC